MTAENVITINASNSGWNFFGTWAGNNLTAGGWVQGSLV